MQGSTAYCNDEEISPSEFLGWMPAELSYDEPKNDDKMWVFWSDTDVRRCSRSNKYWVVASRIMNVLSEFNLPFCPIMLVQFWSPETIGGRRVLSTSRQPFALKSLCRGLCRYRVHSLKYKFKVDDQVEQDKINNTPAPSTHVFGEEEEAVFVQGPPSRVFSSQLPESNPDVRAYSIEDHPQLETALHNDAGSYFTLPVFERHAEDCAGVLEIVLLDYHSNILGLLPEIKRSLEVWDLKTFGGREFLQSQTVAGLQNAMDEIKEVLETACKSHNLPLAQAWIGLPYIHKNLAFHDWNMDKGSITLDLCCTRRVLIHKLVEFLANCWNYLASLFACACELHPLTVGEGLVGNVLSTHKPYFCEDVSLLSLTEYPLSTYADHALLNSCFAICLRSTFTGNLEYVLELFLPYSGNINAESIERVQALLGSIMNTMKQHFRTFKVASGEQLGEEISVQLIRGSMTDQEPGSLFNICQATSPQALEPAGGVQVIDDICQPTSPHPPIAPQPVGGVLVAQQNDDPMKHAPETLANAEQSDTMMQRTSSTVTSVKSHRTSKISLSLEQIQPQFGRSRKEAAENLRVSQSTLKRECRRLNIERWPAVHKRKKLISSSCSTNHQDMNDPGSSSKGGQVPSFGADIRYVNDMTANDTQTFQNISPTRSVTMEAASVQKERGLTVKASYRDDTIKFQLLSSSTFASVEDEIAKSLDLETGTFRLKYKDEEDEWILIKSDKHLRECISSSRGPNRTTIRMLVLPLSSR